MVTRMTNGFETLSVKDKDIEEFIKKGYRPENELKGAKNGKGNK
jgi:hypothetical protein